MEQGKYEIEATYPCIRDDGYLCMGNSIAIEASMGRLRRYHGKLDATMEERLAYLQGLSRTSATSPNQVAIELGKLDIDKMSRTDLITYALDEFGLKVPPKSTLEEVRALVKEAKVASLTPPLTTSGIGEVAPA